MVDFNCTQEAQALPLYMGEVSSCKPHCGWSAKVCCSSEETLHYFLNGLCSCSVIESICKKCEQICCLTLSGTVTWAAAFSHTDQTAGFLNNCAFNYLVNEIELKESHEWPVKVHEMHTFGAESTLQ